jgi:hypothetical protein
MVGRYVYAVVILDLIIAFIYAAQEKETPIRPEAGIVKLFNGKDKTGLYAWLKGSGLKDSKGVFTVHDGMIHASGEDLGYLATDKEYHNYHLIVDYKWGKKHTRVKRSGIPASSFTRLGQMVEQAGCGCLASNAN